ncbi:unnamed protein product [Linum trigynum]
MNGGTRSLVALGGGDVGASGSGRGGDEIGAGFLYLWWRRCDSVVGARRGCRDRRWPGRRRSSWWQTGSGRGGDVVGVSVCSAGSSSTKMGREEELSTVE